MKKICVLLSAAVLAASLAACSAAPAVNETAAPSAEPEVTAIPAAEATVEPTAEPSAESAVDPVQNEDALYDEREHTAEQINQILLHNLRNNIRFCSQCGAALPLHHKGGLCTACWSRRSGYAPWRQGRG